MVITPEKTKQLAQLARLALFGDEAAEFAEQLSGILTYTQQIQSLDTEGTEPMIYPRATKTIMRDDVVVPSLSQEQALANAPQMQDGMFRVPRIIEEE